MISINYIGRLGNNIIQYLAARFFAEKYNTPLLTPPKSLYGDWSKIIKKIPESTFNKKSNYCVVNDTNFLDLIHKNTLDTNTHYIFDGFFQKKEFLIEEQDELKKLLNLNYEPQEKKVFVHYRIGDVANTRACLPLEYYYESLNSIKFEEGFISSDTIDDKNCQELINKYNLKKLPTQKSLDVILFAKNFDNIVLSEGTFSWLIGYFSKSENIICNERNFKWFGDINLPKWKKLHWDWTPEDGYQLNQNHKPIKICY